MIKSFLIGIEFNFQYIMLEGRFGNIISLLFTATSITNQLSWEIKDHDHDHLMDHDATINERLTIHNTRVSNF